jgi:ABC-type Na+ efflux pump permease subunit
MFGMTTMLGVAVVLVQERRMGTLRRLLTTPTNRSSIVAGKFAGALSLVLVQTAILILFGQLAFDVP